MKQKKHHKLLISVVPTHEDIDRWEDVLNNGVFPHWTPYPDCLERLKIEEQIKEARERADREYGKKTCT